MLAQPCDPEAGYGFMIISIDQCCWRQHGALRLGAGMDSKLCYLVRFWNHPKSAADVRLSTKKHKKCSDL